MPKMPFLLPPRIDPADYLTTTETRKLAASRLVTPPSAWSDEVIQSLVRDNPYVPAERAVVNFHKRDDAMGYALGYISIIGAPRVSIPVIIAQRELKPLDTMILRQDDPNADPGANAGTGNTTDDIVLPLTENNFQQALDDAPVGSVVEERDVQGAGYSEDGSALRLPMRNRTVLAHVVGANEHQREAFAQVLAQDKEAAAGFALHGADAVVNAWLTAAVPRGTIKQAFAKIPVKQAEASFLTMLPESISAADTDAAALVLENTQAKRAAFVRTVDLFTGDIRPVAVFDDGTYVHADRQMVGLKLGSAEALDVLALLDSPALRRGTEVMFICGQATTAPAKIASLALDQAAGSVNLQLTDALGRSLAVTMLPQLKTATQADGQWLFPLHGTRVLSLAGHATGQMLPSTPDKVATALRQALPCALIATGGQYTLQTGVPGLDFSAQSKTAAAAALNLWFSNADALLAAAEAQGTVRFASTATEVAAKVASLQQHQVRFQAQAKQLAAKLAMPLDKAVKLAAAMAMPGSADAVLGTGFINEDNVAEFSQMAGAFRDAVSDLARLLLAIRCGHPGDENATAVAMKSLQRVVDNLEASVGNQSDESLATSA